MLLKELVDQWLSRQRKQVELAKMKPASLAAFTSYANNHIIPGLGELSVTDIKNGVVKQFAEDLVAAKKSAKTIREILATLKMILHSHRDENGERILDLSKWDSQWICENVPAGKQKQPTISRDALNAIIRNRALKVRDRVLIALAASTGLRVGELLALKVSGGDEESSWTGDVIHVRKSIWRGQLQLPKTTSAIRDIDLSTPVQIMLEKFAEGIKPGTFLFASRSGKPLTVGYVNEEIMATAGVPATHALRRYRVTWLEEQGCPRGLEAAWIGHSMSDVTSKYDKTAEDREFRRKQVERIGTGLDLDFAVKPQNEASSVAKPKKKSYRAAQVITPDINALAKRFLARQIA